IGDQSARGAAMGGDDTVAHKTAVPFAHSGGHHLVALAIRWNEAPFVLLAGGYSLRIVRMKLRNCETFPIAEGNFHKSLVGPVAGRIKAKHGAQQLHCLRSAPKWTRYIIEIGSGKPLTGEQATQDMTAARRLRTSICIKGNIVAALQAARDVPVGLAVSNVVNDRLRHRGVR